MRMSKIKENEFKVINIGVVKGNSPKISFEKSPRFKKEKVEHDHQMYLVDWDHNVSSYCKKDKGLFSKKFRNSF